MKDEEMMDHDGGGAVKDIEKLSDDERRGIEFDSQCKKFVQTYSTSNAITQPHSGGCQKQEIPMLQRRQQPT